MKTNKNIAIIGLGNISKIHINSLVSLNYNIGYICDIDEKKKEKFSSLKHAKFTTDYKCIQSVDSVHVCTDHYAHYEIVKYFLKKGVDVFCEKILAISIDQVIELSNLAEENNARLAVCYQNRYNPNVAKIQKIIDESVYGELTSVFCEIVWNRPNSYYENNWQSELKYAGGGVLTTQASHTIDLLILLLGDFEIIQSSFLYRESIEVETTAHVKVNFGDVKCLLYATVDAPIDNEVRISFTFEKITIILDGNNLIFKQQGKIIENDYNGEESKEGKSSWGGYHKKAIDEFHKGSNFLEVKSTIKTDEFLESVYRKY